MLPGLLTPPPTATRWSLTLRPPNADSELSRPGPSSVADEPTLVGRQHTVLNAGAVHLHL